MPLHWHKTGIAVLAVAFLFVLCPFSLAQCPHAGNNSGSIPYPPGGPYQGVSFRVWAPHATAVSVKDPVSGRSEPLVAQGTTGYWCKDVPGVGVNRQYDYVITTANFGTVTRRDPNARVVTSANNGHAITYDPTAYLWQVQSFTPKPFNQLVIYEMDVGQFNPGPSGWGTFQSAVAKLDHISGMGFTAVEVLPGDPVQRRSTATLMARPTNTPSTMPNLEVRITLKPLWTPAISAAWLSSSTSFTTTGDLLASRTTNSTAGIPPLFPAEFTFTMMRQQPTTTIHHGARVPISPYPVVKDYILGQITMWFDEYHADGLRWDSVSNIYNTWRGGVGNDPHTGKPGVDLPDGVSLMQTVNTTWPHTFKIAEDLSFGSEVARDLVPVANGGLGFDALQNATLGYFVRKDFPTAHISMADVVHGIDLDLWNSAYLQNVTWVESHNELVTRRIHGSINWLIRRTPPAATLARRRLWVRAWLSHLLRSPWCTMGDEFLDPSWLDNKTTLNWVNADTWAGIVDLYRDLANLRTNAGGTSPGLTDPDLNIYQQDKTNNVMVYDRYSKASPGTDDVIVIANLSGTVFGGTGYEIGLPYGGTWQVLFNSDSTAYSSDFGNVGPAGPVVAVKVPFAGQPYSAMVAVGDYSMLILSRQ